MVQDAIAGLEKALGAEGITSCNCLVKNYSKRKDVGARIGILLANHFGRHVIQCSRELCGGLFDRSLTLNGWEGFFPTQVQSRHLAPWSAHDTLLPAAVVENSPSALRPHDPGP